MPVDDTVTHIYNELRTMIMRHNRMIAMYNATVKNDTELMNYVNLPHANTNEKITIRTQFCSFNQYLLLFVN